jgi:hypothetical protein
MTPSLMTSEIAARTNSDWSANSLISISDWQGFQDTRHRGFHAAHDVERRGRAAFQNGEEGAAHAVLAHDVLLGLVAVAHLGHIAHEDRGAVDGADGEIVEFVENARAGVELHLVFGGADFGGAGRQDEVLRVDRVDDVLGGKIFGFESGEIEIDGDQAGLAAIRPRHGGALDGGEADADLVLADVVELLLGEFSTGDGVLENGDRGGVVADDERGRLAGRELPQNSLGDGGDLGDARVDGGAGLEEDFDDADAVVGVGLDVLDVVDGRAERALVIIEDALLDFRGAQTGVLPDDADDRDVDGGKNIGRRAEQHERRHQDQDERRDDKRVGAPESKTDDPHGQGAPAAAGWGEKENAGEPDAAMGAVGCWKKMAEAMRGDRKWWR